MSIPVNNSGNLSISDKHTINFAVLYNKQPDDELLLMDSSMNVHEITFDSHDITYSEFKNIFYQNSFGVYNINEIYKDSKYLSFNKQTITDDDGISNVINLNDLVISIYEQDYNITRNNINPIKLLSLNKELIKYNSLCDICNIEVFHSFKDLNNILDNRGKLNNKYRLNLKFIYKNDMFKDVEIVFNFNYDVDFS